MLFVGQRVDDVKTCCRRGEFFERPLREGPDDGGMDPPLEISGNIGDRLAASQRDIGLQCDDLSAELADRDFKGRARAKRRLFEQHRHETA